MSTWTSVTCTADSRTKHTRAFSERKARIRGTLRARWPRCRSSSLSSWSRTRRQLGSRLLLQVNKKKGLRSLSDPQEISAIVLFYPFSISANFNEHDKKERPLGGYHITALLYSCSKTYSPQGQGQKRSQISAREPDSCSKFVGPRSRLHRSRFFVTTHIQHFLGYTRYVDFFAPL